MRHDSLLLALVVARGCASAASSSASRSAVGQRRRAPRCIVGAAPRASATDAAASDRSARVYSSSAASPRARTSAMIAATASLDAVDPAPPRRRCSVVERGVEAGARASRRRPARHVSHARLAARAKASISGCSASRFSLSDAGLTISRARDRHDLLDRDQVVRPQRVAGGDEVDDGVGEADQRRELHRAVELDQVDVHALGGEVLARGADVLGRDAQARALLHRAARSRSPRGTATTMRQRPMPRSSGW